MSEKVLDLRGTRISSLPENFICPQSLDISGTNITALPENLMVLGNLILGNAPIQYLPEEFFVAGDLIAPDRFDLIISPKAIIFGEVIGPVYDKPNLPNKMITDKIVIGEDGHSIYYIDKMTLAQRENRDGSPSDYTDIYIGIGDEDMAVYQGKWFIPVKDKNFHIAIQEIEKRKQWERLQGKYKDLALTDTFTLEEIFPIYCDITGACPDAYDKFAPIICSYGFQLEDPLTLKIWIEGSKKAKYKYNYLFTEYFEEEAN